MRQLLALAPERTGAGVASIEAVIDAKEPFTLTESTVPPSMDAKPGDNALIEMSATVELEVDAANRASGLVARAGIALGTLGRVDISRRCRPVGAGDPAARKI